MQRHYDELIRLCYECVLDESRWDALLERLIPLSGRQQGGVVIQARGERYGKVTQYHRCSETAVQRYADYFHRLDPGLDCMPQRQVGLWYHDWEHLSAKTLKLHPYYQEFMRPVDMGHNSYVKLYETPSQTAYLTLITEVGQSTPALDRQNLLERLSPHLQLAGNFASRLANTARQLQYQSLLHCKSDQCLWLVDGNSRLVFANHDAEAMLRLPNPPLFVHQGRLKAQRIETSLAKAIQKAVGMLGPASASLVRLEGNGSHDLVVVPVAADKLPNGSPPLAMVTLPKSNFDLNLPRELFKFTPAETRLAQLLMCGLAPEACASRLNVSITTVRSQLRAMFNKTGTERQAGLVAILAKLSL